jgi:hypothetical protein
MTKIGSKNSLYSHRHFTEHLMSAFEKPPRKSNLNHESSSLLDWRLKKLYRIHPATIYTKKYIDLVEQHFDQGRTLIRHKAATKHYGSTLKNECHEDAQPFHT